jgi:hypothetical protein
MDRELPSKSPSKLSNCQKTDRVAVGFAPHAKKNPVADRVNLFSSADDAHALLPGV